MKRTEAHQRTVVANKFHTQRIMYQDRQDKVQKIAQSVESSKQTIQLKDSKVDTGVSRLPTRTGERNTRQSTRYDKKRQNQQAVLEKDNRLPMSQQTMRSNVATPPLSDQISTPQQSRRRRAVPIMFRSIPNPKQV